VELPAEVKPEEIKATFKDGVIEVRLPKTEEAKKKTITVKVE
jgi:HSP20 family protein